jgi:hypothetical protein
LPGGSARPRRIGGARAAPGSGIEEQVYCTARYGDVPVTFYHGFTQAGRWTVRSCRLLFERGDVTLREWIPTQAVVRTGSGRGQRLGRSRRSFRVRGSTVEQPLRRRLSGRSRRVTRHTTAYQRITLTSAPATKMTVYGDLLRAMLADQLAFIAEPSHPRVITEDNGRESLRMSVRATELAMS